jgi:hypothetical protein
MNSFHPPNPCWDDKSSCGDSGVFMLSAEKVDTLLDVFGRDEVVLFARRAVFFAREVVAKSAAVLEITKLRCLGGQT